MALGREMDDAIHMLLCHELQDTLEVADVHPDKLVVRSVLDVFQIGEVTRISQLVEVDDLIVGIFVDEEADDMTSDETRAAGDNYVLHILFISRNRIFRFCHKESTDNTERVAALKIRQELENLRISLLLPS